MPTHANRVEMTVSGTPGTGTITLGSASSGFQSFASAYGANATVDVLITDGTAWEVARNCTYTHSGTTLSRGTLEASSTGSALSLTSSAVVMVTATAQMGNSLETVWQTYIRGLLVTKNSGGNTLDISAGACYDPSSGKVISYAGATGVSAGTLGASQWNQVYIYDSSGTATIEVVNNAAPPSSTYAGTARQGGTNSNRRWIGSFLTTSGSNIVAHDVVETAANQFETIYLAATNATPYRALSAGSQTTYTAVSLVGIVPRYVCTHALANIVLDATASANVGADLSKDGTNKSVGANAYLSGASVFPGVILTMPVEASTPQVYYKSTGSNTPKTYIDVYGYRGVR